MYKVEIKEPLMGMLVSLSGSMLHKAVEIGAPLAAAAGISSISNLALSGTSLPKVISSFKTSESNQLVLYDPSKKILPILTSSAIITPIVEELLFRGIFEGAASGCLSFLGFSHGRLLASLIVVIGLEIANNPDLRSHEGIKKSLERVLRDFQHSIIASYFGLPAAIASHISNTLCDRVRERIAHQEYFVERTYFDFDHSNFCLEEDMDQEEPLSIEMPEESLDKYSISSNVSEEDLNFIDEDFEEDEILEDEIPLVVKQEEKKEEPAKPDVEVKTTKTTPIFDFNPKPNVLMLMPP